MDLTEREERERESLRREVAFAANLTDADRVRILQDLWETAQTIQRTKSPEQLRREEEMRRREHEEGLARYRALAERLGG